MSVVLTVRVDRGTPEAAALRVRLMCARESGPAMDRAWDLEPLPHGHEGEAVASWGVARMVACMRRLGCRCPLDLSDLGLVTRALARRRA